MDFDDVTQVNKKKILLPKLQQNQVIIAAQIITTSMKGHIPGAMTRHPAHHLYPLYQQQLVDISAQLGPKRKMYL